MITKLTSSLLFAHSYKLVDKEGNEYEIIGLNNQYFTCYKTRFSNRTNYIIRLNQIGTDFFVLCRPLTHLTKEVNGLVPLFEICDSARKGLYWTDGGGKRLVDCHWFKGAKVVEHDAYEAFFNFGYDVESNMFYSCIDPETEDEQTCNVTNQELLFNKLYSFHFKPSSLPDECCRFIEG